MTRHSDDDKQIHDTKILELQKEFTENDAASNIPFLNVFEGGITSFWGSCNKGSYVFGLKMQTRSLVVMKCCKLDALLSYNLEMRKV